MKHIVLLSPRPDKLTEFLSALCRQADTTLHKITTSATMLEFIQDNPTHLVLLDQAIDEENPLDLVINILSHNAMTNTAMITSMDAEQWHEKSEGLGMLPPVPDPPTAEDAQTLLDNLNKLQGLYTGTTEKDDEVTGK